MIDAPYTSADLLKRFSAVTQHVGRRYLIKYGGAAMEREATRNAVCHEIALLSQVGVQLIVVHGGGKEITRLLDRLSIESHFIGGVRVTSPEAMAATEMVLSGSINKELASRITRCGAAALGISGRDAHIIEAVTYRNAGGEDFGETGDVSTCNPKPVEALLHAGLVPVISPVGENGEGRARNLNADFAAAAVAGALKVENCVFLTDVDGVRTETGFQSRLTSAEIAQLIADGVITGGMIPKVKCAIRALDAGCARTTICNAGNEFAVTRAIIGDTAAGTAIER